MTFELNEGKTMELEEAGDVLVATLFDKHGYVMGLINWDANSVCDMLFCETED